MCLGKNKTYVFAFTLMLLVMFSLTSVANTSNSHEDYMFKHSTNQRDIIPNEIFIIRGYITYKDFVKLANVTRNIIFESLNITEYSILKTKIRLINESVERVVEVFPHNLHVFQYVNWSLLEEYVPVVRDPRFKEILKVGYLLEQFVSPRDVVKWWNISSRYIETGKYNYSDGVVLRNKVYSLSVIPNGLGVFEVSMRIQGLKAILEHVDSYNLTQRIAEGILSWFIKEVSKLGLNISRTGKAIIPYGSPNKLDLVNLTPPLPRTYLLVVLNKSVKYLLKINDWRSAQCLVVLVNNSSCLLHVRKDGLIYYKLYGIWDPSKVFYKDEYEHYLKLIQGAGIAKITIPYYRSEVLKTEAYVHVYTPAKWTFICHIYVRGGSEEITMYMYSPVLLAVRLYEYSIPKNIGVDELFDYLNSSCPLIRGYLNSSDNVYDTIAPFRYINSFNISVLEEFWRLVDELNHTYTDSPSRTILNHVVELIVFNEDIAKVRQTHLFIAHWGKNVLKTTLKSDKDLFKYYIVIPRYDIGGYSRRGIWNGGALIYVDKPRLLICINYSKAALEFWKLISSINPNALTKPLQELEKLATHYSTTKSMGTNTTESYSVDLTVTLTPRNELTSSAMTQIISSVLENMSSSRVGVNWATSTNESIIEVLSSTITTSANVTSTATNTLANVGLLDMRLLLIVVLVSLFALLMVLGRYRK